MSEQPGGFLQTNTSYNFHEETNKCYKNKSIDPASFQDWHRRNMYKSSYAHFHSKESVLPKSTAIPGYGGYVPLVKPNNLHAKGFSKLAKESFSSQKICQNIYGLATTGKNIYKESFIDPSQLATSNKYGKSVLQRAHPNWSDSGWVSTTQDFFRDPNRLTRNLQWQKDGRLQHSLTKTRKSGYQTNNANFDGRGWNPDPILRGDHKRTEYRDRFNTRVDFHRDTLYNKIRKLPKKQLNYVFT